MKGTPVKAPTSSRYAEKRRKEASPADPMAYPLVVALVVLPTASSRSVMSLGAQKLWVKREMRG